MTDPVSSATNPQTQASYWNPDLSNPDATAGNDPIRLTTVPQDAQEEAPAAADGTIDGSEEGTKLDGGQTPDGKQIKIGQLHDDDTVSLTREQTIASSGFSQYVSDDQLVLTTKGEGDDQVDIAQRDDGTLDVTVNGESYEVKLAEGQQFALRVGDGNDTVSVAPNVKINFVVEGGAGDDTITTGAGNDNVDGGEGNDTITTGDGNDYVFGNSGDDKIDGGAGNNTIYGGDGGDEITADGTGEVNYFEGGEGDDIIDASKGKNVVSGGKGDDAITSGGSNTIYTGDGSDSVEGVTTQDKVHAQTGVDQIAFAAGQSDNGQVVVNVRVDPALGTQGIKVEGSPAFVQRVEADLEMLRSSPAGQQMLASFDEVAAEKGHTLTIREFSREVNSVTYPADPNARLSDIQIGADNKPAEGMDTIVEYNASIDLDSAIGKFGGFLPNVVLYHEMSHAYNMTHGTLLAGDYKGSGPDAQAGVPNSERQAVGLETTATPFDFGDGSGPLTHNPIALTENGLRREFGLADRPSYAL